MNVKTNPNARIQAKRTALSALGMLMACTALFTGQLAAQDSTASQIDSLAIPADAKILKPADPNIRQATAVVNGSIITRTDVDQRLALILAANEGAITDEDKKHLREQVLRNLIDETLQIQEALASDITVSDSEIETTYAQVAAQNFREDPRKIDDYLRKIGSSPESLKQQIRAELSWQEVLRYKIAPFINVSREEVNEVLNRMTAAKGTDEYRIGEIFLASNSQNHNEVHATATSIMNQLREGGSFVAYARQYSQASTAAVGGDLGWVHLAQLPEQLAATAAQMQRGELAGPIEIPGGFSIIAVIDKRKILSEGPSDAILSLKQISITFGSGTTEAEATRRATEFANAIGKIKSCAAVDAAAAQFNAQVVENDQIRASDLPPALQDAVLKLDIGESSPPFGSINEGVRVLMLCGREDVSAGGNQPSFNDVMNQLENDRINKRAQMYLRDLRRDAVIEYN